MLFRSLALLLILTLPVFADDADSLLSAAGPAESRKEVIALLRQNRQKYGDDAAIMQGLLLVHAIQADAVLSTEATIVGFEELEGNRYVSLRLVTGAVFNDNEISRDERLERIWHSVLERTLLRYPTFSVPGDGVVVEMVYNHRPYSSVAELYRTIGTEGEVERAKFYILTRELGPFLDRRREAQQLLEHSRILLDGSAVRMTLRESAFVGPPLPR